jgi:tetratricopeptide (TPR) repeat protein
VPFALAALVSACASTLSVDSEPASAEVYLSQSPTQKTGQALGQTPLEVKLSDLPLERGGYLIIEKPGYMRETILISEPALGTTRTEIFMRLTQGSRDGEKASTLLGILTSAQEQVQQGKIDLAHVTIDRALQIDPYFVRGITFKAALFFMDKKYAESEELYKRALGLDPNLAEASRMLARIDTAKKGATP